jgi:hypothetical protein
VCKRGIFSHPIINIEKVCISLELFMTNYSSKEYVKENALLNCRMFFTDKNCLFQKMFIDS